MKFIQTRAALLGTLSLLLSVATQAQGQPLTRAEVKKETSAAAAAGALIPAGDAGRVVIDSSAKSTLTRSQRKEDTLQARKNNELVPTGGSASVKSDFALRALPTTRDASERMEETRLARKRGELVPAGEGPDAPTK